MTNTFFNWRSSCTPVFPHIYYILLFS